MTQQTPCSDPWSSFAPASVDPTEMRPPAIHPAFESDDQIGYDTRMPLPDLCIKCVQPAGRATRRLRHRHHGKAYDVHLPMCGACKAGHRNARLWMFLAGAFPFVLILLSLAQQAAGDALPGWALWLALLGSFTVTAYKAITLHLRWRIDVEYDSDGFVKVRGVHPHVRAAILEASRAEAAVGR